MHIYHTFLQWNMETASYKVLMEGYVQFIFENMETVHFYISDYKRNALFFTF